VKNWLRAAPRFTMHFAPSEEAWLAHVEHWFAYQAAREAFHGDKSSAAALSQGISTWMQATQAGQAAPVEAEEDDEATPRAYVWIKPGR
jgi:hypothetical protein